MCARYQGFGAYGQTHRSVTTVSFPTEMGIIRKPMTKQVQPVSKAKNNTHRPLPTAGNYIICSALCQAVLFVARDCFKVVGDIKSMKINVYFFTPIPAFPRQGGRGLKSTMASVSAPSLVKWKGLKVNYGKRFCSFPRQVEGA